ncbi:hypothetical protein PO909_006463 [Leuciscus waleckii]
MFLSCVSITEKPGQCPSTKSGGGKCAELCSCDRDCPKHEKCCSNGCGRQCMAPFTGTTCCSCFACFVLYIYIYIRGGHRYIFLI